MKFSPIFAVGLVLILSNVLAEHHVDSIEADYNHGTITNNARARSYNYSTAEQSNVDSLEAEYNYGTNSNKARARSYNSDLVPGILFWDISLTIIYLYKSRAF